MALALHGSSAQERPPPEEAPGDLAASGPKALLHVKALKLTQSMQVLQGGLPERNGGAHTARAAEV